MEFIEKRLFDIEKQLTRIADQLEIRNKKDMGLDYVHAKNMLKDDRRR